MRTRWPTFVVLVVLVALILVMQHRVNAIDGQLSNLKEDIRRAESFRDYLPSLLRTEFATFGQHMADWMVGHGGASDKRPVRPLQRGD